MKKPRGLSKGCGVGVFLPSSPVKEPFRSNGLEQLSRMGYHAFEVPGISSKVPTADFLARTPEEGFADFQHLFIAPEIRALWAARGGYGSNYLLPLVDRLRFREPKIVIGSSDVSYLLWFLLDRLKMVVFYGPMAYSSIAEGRFDEQNLVQVLTGNYDKLQIKGDVLIPGVCKGIVTGGCLSNFVSLIGTPFLPYIENRVLLLEDTGERPYRLDRMFWQLTQTGLLSRVSGLILGEFPGCFVNLRERDAFFNQIRDFLAPYGVPVIYNLPFGHGKNIHTLPLGIEVEIDTTRFEGLILEEKGISEE